jgi:hypothetical protein
MLLVLSRVAEVCSTGRVVGHGVEANGTAYCCANCALTAGIAGIRDRVRHLGRDSAARRHDRDGDEVATRRAENMDGGVCAIRMGVQHYRSCRW